MKKETKGWYYIPFPPKDKNANHTGERFKKNETSTKKKKRAKV